MKNYSKYLKKKSSVIFLFHGVIDKNPFKIRNYTKKHLLKKEFIKVLDDLSKKGNCISLDQLRYNIENKKNFKDYSYSITFDDGFYNNYKIAAPILKKKKLYATFYLTTSFIEKNETSWMDKIEHMIEKVKTKKIINVFNKKFKIDNNKKTKINFLNSIRYFAKKNNIDFNKLVLDIKKQLDFNYKINNLNNILDKKMNWNQVRKLNQCKYFTVGGHTVNHPILSFLSNMKAKKEIYNSINTIKKNTKIKIKHYSYPEGLKHTYGKREIKLLKNKGIKICPSAEFGFNNKSTDLFNLKRIFVNS
jgi:peptidoglycan/xylan/chitin deacetylase (PgdA/CDA1 family)